ncbi:MAG: phage tail sheath C-terminal domain-containing protein [Candidatus Heteroscillospira sp.]|jgi:phage tail sheath gpL-like
MAMNERPGVYSGYEVTSSVSGRADGAAAACAAVGEKGSDRGVVRISSRAAAAEVFGAGGITELCATALRNGAGCVYACALEEGASASDYAEAFEKLCTAENVGMMFCDSRDGAVHAAMRGAILGASEAYRYRIGIAESAGDTDELLKAAKALDCERMVLCAAEETGIPGALAAALAGAAAGTADPALPLNGTGLSGVEFGKLWTDDEVNTLVRGGVTLAENVSGTPVVLRAVTTRTTTGGVQDATWRELTTVRIIDEVIPGIRDSLRRRFARAKNTVQTRGAIRTQVIVELEKRLEREIIDSYGEVTVSPSGEDPTVCQVSFAFTVAHGLNHIRLEAKITV